MNEREDIREIAFKKFKDFQGPQYPYYCLNPGDMWSTHMHTFFSSWQARTEIAKQDEKELIEALIETTMKMEEESIAHHWDKICPARSRMINNIIVIEKHTGKTWEELNESEPKRN